MGYQRLARCCLGSGMDYGALPVDLKAVLTEAQVAVMRRVDVGIHGPRWGRHAGLTPQERRAADLVLAGHKRAAAAELLGVSGSTFDNHRRMALGKLGCVNEVALLRAAIVNGWLVQ